MAPRRQRDMCGAALILAVCLAESLGASDGAGTARLTIHLSIDQSGGLSATQLTEAVDQVRKIWKPAGIGVTSGRYAEPAKPGEMVISLRMLGTPARKSDQSLVLAWASLSPGGAPTPALFVSMPAVSELLSKTMVRGRPLTPASTGAARLSHREGDRAGCGARARTLPPSYTRTRQVGTAASGVFGRRPDRARTPAIQSASERMAGRSPGGRQGGAAAGQLTLTRSVKRLGLLDS